MLRKRRLLDNLKEKATKLKETGIEEAKKFAEERISDETIEKVRSKGKEIIQNVENTNESVDVPATPKNEGVMEKTEGSSELEFFPGLVPEGLMGIFRLAREPGAARSGDMSLGSWLG